MSVPQAATTRSDAVAVALPPAAARPSSWLSPVRLLVTGLLGCALITVIGAVYSPLLRPVFVYDDQVLIGDNVALHPEQPWLTALTQPEFPGAGTARYRPLPVLLGRLLFRFLGTQATLWNAFQLFLFVVLVMLVLLLAHSLTNDAAVAGLAAFLFALHPANVEAVALIGLHGTLLHGIGVVLALWAFGLYLRIGHVGLAAMTLIGVFLAVSSREYGLFVPIFLALRLAVGPGYFVLAIARRRRRRRSGNLPKSLFLFAKRCATAHKSYSSGVLRLLGLSFLPPGIYLVIRNMVAVEPFFDLPTGLNALGEALAVAPFVIWHYLLRCFLPFRLAPVTPFATQQLGLNTIIAVWSCLFLAVGLALLLLRNRTQRQTSLVQDTRPRKETGKPCGHDDALAVSDARGRLGFALLVALVLAGSALLPFCLVAFLPPERLLQDRYLLLALVGWSIAGSIVVTARWQQRRSWWRWGIAICLLYGLAQQTHRQCMIWRDDITLFRHATTCVPSSAVAWQNLGMALLRSNDYEGAAECFRHSAVLGLPGQSAIGRALAAFRQQRYQEAAELFAQGKASGIALSCAELQAWGISSLRTARYGDAYYVFQELNEAYPDCVEGLLFMGVARMGRGDWSEAREILLQAWEKEPGRVDVAKFLAIVEDALGNSQAAERWRQHTQ